MESIKNRYILLVIILFVLGLVIHHIDYKIFSNPNDGLNAINKIPSKFGKWKGSDVFLDSKIYKILETKAIIHRNYKSDIGSVFLSIVFYPDTKVDFHAPEACLGGSGKRLETSDKILTLFVDKYPYKLSIKEIIRKNKEYNELIYYFYKAGNYIGENYLELRFNIGLNKIFSSDTSGVLIRFSTYFGNLSKDSASDVLKSFIEELYPYIIKNL